jgi:ribosomal-protein-alanine N-acetyltransferase
VTRSDPAAGRLSSYAFPRELRVDELLLRVATEDDAGTIAPAFLDPAVGGEAGLPPVDDVTLKGMLRELLPMFERGLLCPYVIEDVPSGELVGGATLHHFDPMHDSVEVGYWLFTSTRGRGIATRSVRALGEHAFANGIVRYEAHVRVGNTPSERVLERCGFTREGVRRRYLRHGNRRVDATLFALLSDDA